MHLSSLFLLKMFPSPNLIMLCWIRYGVTWVICFWFVVTADTLMPSYTTTQTNKRQRDGVTQVSFSYRNNHKNHTEVPFYDHFMDLDKSVVTMN